jgi:hypothetical protein
MSDCIPPKSLFFPSIPLLSRKEISEINYFSRRDLLIECVQLGTWEHEKEKELLKQYANGTKLKEIWERRLTNAIEG